MRSVGNKEYYTHPASICQLFSAFFSIFFSRQQPQPSLESFPPPPREAIAAGGRFGCSRSRSSRCPSFGGGWRSCWPTTFMVSALSFPHTARKMSPFVRPFPHVLRQEEQQVKLHPGQGHRPPLAGHLSGAAVDGQAADGQGCWVLRENCSASMCSRRSSAKICSSSAGSFCLLLIMIILSVPRFLTLPP